MSYHTHNETKDHSATVQIIADAIDRSIDEGDVAIIDGNESIVEQLRAECEDENGPEFSGVNLDGDVWRVRVIMVD